MCLRRRCNAPGDPANDEVNDEKRRADQHEPFRSPHPRKPHTDRIFADSRFGQKLNRRAGLDTGREPRREYAAAWASVRECHSKVGTSSSPPGVRWSEE